jgi:hypothetical protein
VTPLLQYHFNWKTLSAMVGVTWWNCYFRFFPGTIRCLQIIEFLPPPAATHSRPIDDRLVHAEVVEPVAIMVTLQGGER